MDKSEHATRLRLAMAERGVSRQAVAKAVGRNVRTVGNWTSREDPTMPTDLDRAILRRILGPYDEAGDPVELAVRTSSLTEDRQHAVLSMYKRQLREQAEEKTRRLGA